MIVALIARRHSVMPTTSATNLEVRHPTAGRVDAVSIGDGQRNRPTTDLPPGGAGRRCVTYGRQPRQSERESTGSPSSPSCVRWERSVPRLYRERRSVGGPGSCVPRSTDGEHAPVTSLLVGHPWADGVGRDCHASAHVVLRRRQLVHRCRFCLFQHRQHRLSPSAQHRTTQNEWRPTQRPRQVEAMIRMPASRTVNGHRFTAVPVSSRQAESRFL